jgi:DNA-directed RNA polymerase subunit RPC12/RpoP
VPIHFVDRTRGASKIPRIQIVFSAIDLLKLAANRLNIARDLKPDVFVNDACTNCGDRVLAMNDRDDPSDDPIYTCLRCNTEQVPASVMSGNSK